MHDKEYFMKTKISFHNMPHSEALEKHCLDKLKKFNSFFKNNTTNPLHIELWLNANKIHPHHSVTMHFKTPTFDLNAHSEGTDMYAVVDETIHTMLALLTKEKDKLKSKKKSLSSEKVLFNSY